MAETATARMPVNVGRGALLCVALLLTACAGSQQPVFEREAFGSTGTYTHAYAGTPSRTCEAARRALLSQGYVVETATAELVKGHKDFQPEVETHIQIAFSVVCVMDADSGGGAPARTLAFVNAVQDRYALKKSNNSASVGLSVLGSVSLPFSSSDDSLVKVASETIGATDFYGRFFKLVEHYLGPEVAEAPFATSSATGGALAPSTGLTPTPTLTAVKASASGPAATPALSPASSPS